MIVDVVLCPTAGMDSKPDGKPTKRKYEMEPPDEEDFDYTNSDGMSEDDESIVSKCKTKEEMEERKYSWEVEKFRDRERKRRKKEDEELSTRILPFVKVPHDDSPGKEVATYSDQTIDSEFNEGFNYYPPDGESIISQCDSQVTAEEEWQECLKRQHEARKRQVEDEQLRLAMTLYLKKH
jgi:hypothetical protein